MATRKGEADDLAQLSKLDEATLLEELRFRYSQDKIYVSIAPHQSRILAAIDYMYVEAAMNQLNIHIHASAIGAWHLTRLNIYSTSLHVL